MARKISRRTRARSRTEPPRGLAKYLGLISSSVGLPGRIRRPSASELEEINKVIETINATKTVPDLPQQFWTDDVQVDCALAAATFVAAGAALAAGQVPVAAAAGLVAAKALADAVKGANKDCKAGCGMATLEEMVSLEANILKGATNSISLSGLTAARDILIQTVLQQRVKSPRSRSTRSTSRR